MLHRLLTLAFCFLLFTVGFAQAPKLLLRSGTIVPEVQYDWPPTEQAHQGFYFRLVQFDEIPTNEEKKELASAGITLMDYLPHYAFFVAIKQGKTIDWKGLGARAVLEIQPEWKQHPDLAGEAELMISYHPVLEADPVIGALVAHGATLLQQNNNTQLLAIRISPEKINDLLELPFLSFIEAMPPDPVEERQHFYSGSRANFLAEKYGFDGSGVVLAVAEGRIHPPLIDLHNRLDVSLHPNTNSGGHATAVSRFMAGAGNENPQDRGMAYGADVLSFSYAIWNDAPTLYTNPGLRVSNQSWGSGCNGGYNGDARTVDIRVSTLPSFMMVFSAGNSQGSNCGYGGGSGWGTITGGVKSAKNVIAVGSLTRYDELAGFSSIGPATDGRIKPDISTTGEGGTSFASPTISGVYAQLHQAFMAHNAGNEPPSGLMKAIIQNTADEIGNPGPDYKHGYGKANARKAYRAISEATWTQSSVGNAQQQTVSLSIPSGVREAKIMVYWTDAPALANAAKALVNDLDMEVVSPGGSPSFLPWVLNPTADSLTLDDDAIRSVDTLNNMEQVTLLNPTAGTYQIQINGTEVPMGPQTFYVVTQVYQDELVLTYPLGNEGFVPGEKEILRWDATGTGNYDLEFSLNGGSAWQSLATGIPVSQRYYEWTIPDTLKGNVQVRVSSGAMSDTSDDFTISALPQNVSVFWACADSIKLVWDSVHQASGYRIRKLGNKYMDSVTTVTQSEVILYNQSTTDTLWFAVQAIGADNAVSRRTIAIRKNPGNFNCIPFNVSAEKVISHPSGYLPACHVSTAKPLGVRIRNHGVRAISNVPVRYRINGGPVTTGTVSQTIPSGSTVDFYFPGTVNFSFTGTYDVEVWTDYAGDPVLTNDTTKIGLVVYPGQIVVPNYVQDFDTFTNCSTAWGCSDITCRLTAGWFNVPNVPSIAGDSIDFRTNNGGTGSGNTGPSNDHTTGTNVGKYLYLEGSGNAGAGCQNKTAMLHSPCIDLANTNQPRLSFWRHMFGGAIGEFHVDILSQGQWVEDVIPSVSGSMGDMWIQGIVDLSAYTNETIVVRFRASTGNGFAGDLAIDDIQISTLPSTAFSSNFQNVCPNTTVQFTDASFHVTSRKWNFSPSNIAFTGGASASSKNPTVIFTQPGIYTVTLVNTNAAGNDTLVQTAYINAGPHMLTLTTDDADNIICSGDSVTLIASSIGTTTTFKANGTSLQSGTATTFVIPNLSTSSIYTAVGTLYPGCLTTEPAVFLTFNDPQVSVTPIDSVTICEGDSVLVTADAGFASYQWSDGSTGQFITTGMAGTYNVTATNIVGCEAQSNSVVVNLNPAPAAPVLDGALNGSYISLVPHQFVVVVQPGATYQWGSSDSTSIIADNDTVLFTFFDIGSTTVWVVEISDEGCPGDTLFFTIDVVVSVGVDPSEFLPSYTVFPNPADQELFVEFESDFREEVTLILFDEIGRQVRSITSRESRNRMTLAGLAAGAYILEIRFEKEVVREKVWIR